MSKFDYVVADRMRRLGGDVEVHLGLAILAGGATVAHKIRVMFPEYWREYGYPETEEVVLSEEVE